MTSKSKHYAGIGQRSIPEHIAQKMKQTASKLEALGYILRSGGAKGSDSAFESGVLNNKSKLIYRPWDDGNGIALSGEEFLWAYNMIERYNIIPWIDSLSQIALRLHIRNVFVVTDMQDRNADFVIYYCDKGSGFETKGGTRTAVVLAQKLGIKTYNMYEENVMREINKFIA